MDSIFYFLDVNFWSNPLLIIAFAVSIFAVLLVRYFGTAVIYRTILKSTFKFRFRNSKTSQLRREIAWSVISSVIFTVLAVGTFYLFQNGYTKIYTTFSDRSVVYFIFSIFLMLILYETYYYWLHRWMHKPGVFKIVHKVHHESIHPTVFTSFSFHPTEAILQFIFLPIMITLIPVHYYALGIVLMAMTISAVINHAGVEIFPKKFVMHPIGRWLIGSTHHDLHHKEFRTNFGLYLTLWDRIMKTENPHFEKEFQTNREKLNQSQSLHHQSTGDQHR